MAEREVEKITLMILGRTGAGKSLLGNKLLGLEEDEYFFNVARNTSVKSRETIASNFRMRHFSTERLLLRVLDTPGLFDDKDVIADRWLDVLKAYHLARGDIDALVIVISLQDFQNGTDVMKTLMMYFENMTKHTVVVFTKRNTEDFDEGKTLSQFNKIYPFGSAGISFVFSDQLAVDHMQERSLNEIMEHVKRIKKLRPAGQEDIKNFFVANLKKKIKSKGINPDIETLESLRRYSDLEIDLVGKYVDHDKLDTMLAELKNEGSQSTSSGACIIL